MKTTMRCLYPHIRAAKNKKKIVTVPNGGEDVEKLCLSYIADRNMK